MLQITYDIRLKTEGLKKHSLKIEGLKKNPFNQPVGITHVNKINKMTKIRFIRYFIQHDKISHWKMKILHSECKYCIHKAIIPLTNQILCGWTDCILPRTDFFLNRMVHRASVHKYSMKNYTWLYRYCQRKIHHSISWILYRYWSEFLCFLSVQYLQPGNKFMKYCKKST